MIGIFVRKVSSVECLLKVRGGSSVKIEEVQVWESRMRLIDVKALKLATVIMKEVRVQNVNMDRDSIMISLKDLNNASLELQDSSFENITGD